MRGCWKIELGLIAVKVMPYFVSKGISSIIPTHYAFKSDLDSRKVLITACFTFVKPRFIEHIDLQVRSSHRVIYSVDSTASTFNNLPDH
jgi:hypothetical protein